LESASTGAAAVRGANSANAAPYMPPAVTGEASLPTLDGTLPESMFASMEVMSTDSVANAKAGELLRNPWDDYGFKVYNQCDIQWNGVVIVSSPPPVHKASQEKFISLDTSPVYRGRTFPVEVFHSGENDTWVFADAQLCIVGDKPYLTLFDVRAKKPAFLNLLQMQKEGYLHLYEYGHSKPKAMPLNSEESHLLDGYHGDFDTVIKILSLNHKDKGGLKPSKVMPHR
jgi:hypothetical protein